MQNANLVFGLVGALAAALITWIGLPIQIYRILKRKSIEGIEPSIIVGGYLIYLMFRYWDTRKKPVGRGG